MLRMMVDQIVLLRRYILVIYWIQDDIVGKYIDFGEALGKHSQVDGEIEEDDIIEIKVSQSVIDELGCIFKDGNIIGYNPLEYIGE